MPLATDVGTRVEPDTVYRYRVQVDGRAWASGQRWDWLPNASGGYDRIAEEEGPTGPKCFGLAS